MPTFYGAIDLSKNELRNAVVQNLGSAPSSPSKGQLYLNTSDNTLYFWDGTAWVSTRSAGSITPATTVTDSAVGDAQVVGVSTNYARQDHKHGREAFGAVTAQPSFGMASGNGSNTTLARSDHTHGTPAHDNTAHNTIPISALNTALANVNMGGFKITSLADPTATTDAANKQYVDNLTAGLSWKEAVRAATTANGTLASAFANGSVIDGVTLATGNRILLKNQTTTAENGIYTVNASGAPTRATDADAAGELEGAAVFVMEGTTQADTGWVCTTNAPITVGSTGLSFSQFSGGGTISAGAGLTLTGNVIDLVAGDTSLTVGTDNVIVNTAVIATVASLATYTKKYAAALTGNVAYATGEVVTHNLNTRDVQVEVVNGNSPWQAVEVDWEATSVNTVTIRYNPNLGAGFRAVVIG